MSSFQESRVSAVNRWWRRSDGRSLWLETTGRHDLGLDLNAPQEGEDGKPKWHYKMINEVREGDAVLHYRTRPFQEIAAWSRAIGGPYEDEVFWGALGQAGGRGPVSPYERPGFRIGLEGPFLLEEPIPLSHLREREGEIRTLKNKLEEEVGSPSYFPFQLSERRELRTTQFYLAPLPWSFVDLFSSLGIVRSVASNAETMLHKAELDDDAAVTPGTEYRVEDENVETAVRDPFLVDPAAVDRALSAHKQTQNALAAHVRSKGFEPLSPSPRDPQFDLAWVEGMALVVAEVKSITASNEEKQLRLGLGQVLRYRHLLENEGRTVQLVLAVEREPYDETWLELCGRVGVTLTWPSRFESIWE